MTVLFHYYVMQSKENEHTLHDKDYTMLVKDIARYLIRYAYLLKGETRYLLVVNLVYEKI